MFLKTTGWIWSYTLYSTAPLEYLIVMSVLHTLPSYQTEQRRTQYIAIVLWMYIQYTVTRFLYSLNNILPIIYACRAVYSTVKGTVSRDFYTPNIFPNLSGPLIYMQKWLQFRGDIRNKSLNLHWKVKKNNWLFKLDFYSSSKAMISHIICIDWLSL